MAHYAFLDENNIVTEVIVGKNEGEDGVDWERTMAHFEVRPASAPHTTLIGGVHSGGGTPFRKNYAGIGYTYDADRDAFIPPKPYASWVLNEQTCLWDAPVPMPEDASPEKRYTWDEDSINWVEVQDGT
jgi:hypothetical protein